MTEKNFYISKSNFTGGQWSPDMRGRYDLPQYDSAVEIMQNFIPFPQGGCRVRPGTRFVAPAKYHDKNTVLLDFQFNNEQTYVVEMGDEYMRFFTQNSRIESSPLTITNVTNNAGTIVVTSAAHGYSNGWFVAVRGVLGTYEANGDWTVANVTTDTFELSGSVYTNAYVSGGQVSRITEVVSPYDHLDLYELKTAGEGDTLYLFHINYPTYKLVRTSATTFTLSAVDWTVTPFLETNVSATTLQAQGTTVGSSVVVNASSSVFNSNTVGNYYRIANGVVKLTAVANGTHGTGTIKKATVNAATTDWAQGAWNFGYGYPIDGEFYENRLVVVGSTRHPLRMWGSKYIPEHENFDKGTALASDSYEYDLSAKHASVVRWVVGDDLLFVGTAGREVKVTGSENSAITPTSILARPQSSHGALDIEPVVTTSGVVFAQRSGKKVRVIRFDLGQDKYLAPDTTLLAKTILQNAVVQLSYEAEPNELIYACCGDGKWRTLTLLSDQNVQAWAEHVTRGFVLSVESIKTTADDQTWIAVKRSVNGQFKTYIEYLDPDLALDSAVVGDFPLGTTGISSGLTHLEGELVSVLGDGAVLPTQTVVGHALPNEFDSSATSVVVGLPFDPYLKFLPPGKELPEGFIAGRKFRVVRVKLLVNETQGLSVNGDLNYVRSTEDFMDEAPPAGSQYIEFTPGLDWGQPVEIVQHLPLPAQILAAIMYVEIGE